MAFYRILLRQEYRGTEIQNVFHLEDETNLITQDLIAQRVLAQWVEHVRKLQSNQLRYHQIQVTRILFEFPLATHVLDTNVFGTVTGTQAIKFEAFKLRFLTPLLGKKHRGRYFIGGLPQGHISQNAEGMSAPAITLYGTTILTLSDEWADPNPNTFLNLVIAHKDGSTPTRVSSIGFDSFMTHLHSRKQGVGI